jgi:hypothetical protein
MSARVFLHVGLPKSGTSYLQNVLAANKPELAERDGVLFPGDSWKDQVAAVRDVRRMSRRRQSRGAWRRLVTEVAGWSGDSVVSMEWLCAATPEDVRRIADELAPAEVHAIFTVRDIGRTLPSSWQEMMQNRKPWTWEEFLESVTAPPGAGGRAGRRFWSQRDLAELLPRWVDTLPHGRVHVVTVPPAAAGEDELWRRFCSVLEIDPEGYRTRDLGGNASLGLESAEVMRRVNVVVRRSGLSLPDYHTVYKRLVAKRVLAARRGRETRLSVPESLHGWLQEAAERQRAAILDCGVGVVGDLADLDPMPPSEGKQPAEVPLEEVLAAAVDALVGLADQHLAVLTSLEKARKEQAVLRRRLARAGLRERESARTRPSRAGGRRSTP